MKKKKKNQQAFLRLFQEIHGNDIDPRKHIFSVRIWKILQCTPVILVWLTAMVFSAAYGYLQYGNDYDLREASHVVMKSGVFAVPTILILSVGLYVWYVYWEIGAVVVYLVKRWLHFKKLLKRYGIKSIITAESRADMAGIFASKISCLVIGVMNARKYGKFDSEQKLCRELRGVYDLAQVLKFKVSDENCLFKGEVVVEV